MTSTRIEATRQSQHAKFRRRYMVCESVHCDRPLSIAEIAEEFCETCAKSISPREVQEGRAS